MPTITITKNYLDSTTLTQAQLDDAFDSVSSFLNSTKIDSDNIQTGGIATASLATGSVTTVKLASNAVTNAKLSSSASVDADRAVSTNSIKDNAVTGDKLVDLDIYNCSITSSVAANALTIALKTAAGSDPSSTDYCGIMFRSSTATSGVRSYAKATAATSLTISSGSTLGHSDATEGLIFIYAINNGGTVELGASSKLFDEGTLQSSTAEGGVGGADTFATLYSTTARSNKAIRLIGRLKSTQTTAGTWAAAMTEVAPSMFDKHAAPASATQTFTSSGTYIVGPGTNRVNVLICGGGAGGGAGLPTDGNTSFNFSKCGAAGGTSSFGSYITAYGGQPVSAPYITLPTKGGQSYGAGGAGCDYSSEVDGSVGGYGAGGGGGGTNQDSTGTATAPGAGGGGAPVISRDVAVTPGESITVTIGAGGAGGAVTGGWHKAGGAGGGGICIVTVTG